MIEYIPSFIHANTRTVQVPTAWTGLEKIIPAIIEDFGLTPDRAIEFGCDYGYSTAALANFFGHVTGVDHFLGDGHAGFRENLIEQTQEALKDFSNITLVQASYQDFTKSNNDHYSLCHIDIVHNFDETYECGKWAINHCDCLIGHDTESFPEVKRAFEYLAKDSGRTFYNYPHSHGLGILSRREVLK